MPKSEDDCKDCNLNIIFLCPKMLVEIGSFVCICILVHLSKTNPFKVHIIGDLTLYFNDVDKENITIDDINTNISITNNVTNKSSGLRYLVSESFCSDIHDKFKKYKGSKLSSIFELNYEIVHRLSLVNMIVSTALLFILILAIIFRKAIENFHPHPILGCLIYMIIMPAYAGRFVLSLIMFYYFEKGDIEKYDDFLDCPNIKVNYFKNFSDVDTFRKVTFAFLVLNIVSQGIEKIEKCHNFGKEMDEEEKGHKPNLSFSRSS